MNLFKKKLTFIKQYLTFTLMLVMCLLLLGMPIANAEINTDRFEGNIFVLYAGNGSLMPPKVTLAQSIAGAKPTILVYYVDDSSDCKQYAIVVSNMQAFYGRAADIIPVNVDTIPVQSSYKPTEAGYYYKEIVPQVVILDKAGKVVLDKQGQVPYEEVDDKLRQVFDLLPRSESKELKLRPINEFNNELVEQSTK